MEILQALILKHPTTKLDMFMKEIKQFPMEVFSTENEEEAMDKMRNGYYQLLIIDDKIERATRIKVETMAEVLFPGAANIPLSLEDEVVVRFKMMHILHEWKKSQSDGGLHLFDDPDL